MGTASAIGLRNNDGTISAIYCNWDGYISHNGRILLEHYDHAKTVQLMQVGNLSSLKPEVGEAHNFDEIYDQNEPEYLWCRAYGRDRGETDQEAVIVADEHEFFDIQGAEFYYLMEHDTEWRVRKDNKDRWEMLRGHADLLE